MRKRLMMTLFGVLSGFAMAFADDVNYSGTVVTADGEPLMGATVTVTGTSVSTITDMDGKFSLIVPDGYSTVTVTYSGMKKQVVNVTREPIMLYATAEKAELARQARLAALKKPSSNRTYKRNAFNLEFSAGSATGDWSDYLDAWEIAEDVTLGTHVSVNFGWKHNFSQYFGWHFIDLGATTFVTRLFTELEPEEHLIASATTGPSFSYPFYKGLSVFAEATTGVSYTWFNDHWNWIIRPRIGVNLGKWVYVAYKYEMIQTSSGTARVKNYRTGSWYKNPSKITSHNICLGFNF